MPPRPTAVSQTAPAAIGYVRVSTAREEMISPETQRTAIEVYCARKGYRLLEHVEDLDKTGRNFAREGIQQTIARIERREAAVVVVWKFSRFGRNRKGWALNLARVEEAGGGLESATEEVDAKTAAGKLSRGILAEFAAFQSDVIGEEWQDAHANRRERGLPHTGFKVFGYIYHRTTSPIRDGIRICPEGCELGACSTGYVIDPATGAYAAEIYQRYNAGDSVRAIAIWLNSSGITTVRGNDIWNPSAVRNYLHSGFAVGLIRQHFPSCPCKTPQTCEYNRWLPGAHKPVFDNAPEVWEAFRTNLKRRARYPTRTETPTYPLAGIAVCARCGGAMQAQSKAWPDGRYEPGFRYFCGRYLRANLCEGGSIRRSAVEERVRAWVDRLAGDANEEARQVKITASRKDRAASRKNLARQQEESKAALTKLTLSLARDLVSEQAYMAARAELEQEAAAIQAKIDETEAADEPVAGPDIRVARELSATWDFVTVARKRQFLAHLLGTVTVEAFPYGRERAKLEALTPWGERVAL